MSPGGSDFNGTLDVFLSLYIGKIEHGLRYSFVFIGTEHVGFRCYLFRSTEEGCGFRQMRDRIDVHFLNNRRLFCVFSGDEDVFYAVLFRGECHGEAALYAANASIKCDFAEHHGVFKPFNTYLIRGGEDADGNRQVKRGTGFSDVGRREVGSDAAGWKIETGVFNRCGNPVFALADGTIGQTDGAERGEPFGDIHLDFDDIGINS